MYIYYEIVFEKREMVERRLGELERVGAGLHHYTTTRGGRKGYACFPCVSETGLQSSPRIAKRWQWIAGVKPKGIIVPPGHVWDGWDMW
jgi:hypothetical protein